LMILTAGGLKFSKGLSDLKLIRMLISCSHMDYRKAAKTKTQIFTFNVKRNRKELTLGNKSCNLEPRHGVALCPESPNLMISERNWVIDGCIRNARLVLVLTIVVREKMCHILQTSRMVTLKCQEEMVKESKKSNDTSAAKAMHEALNEESGQLGSTALSK
jgi:hypothetical protein